MRKGATAASALQAGPSGADLADGLGRSFGETGFAIRGEDGSSSNPKRVRTGEPMAVGLVGALTF